jgi:hypothetical protein
MAIFCKVFEREGQQVLVTTGYDDDSDLYKVAFETRTLQSGYSLKTTLGFASEGDRDDVFKSTDEDMAFGVVKKLPGYDL